MASQNDNPYKRMKKSLKGGKLPSDKVQAMAMKAVKTTGKSHGKSNKLGQGGRAAQLKAQGVPGGVIGNLARAAQAAPGQKNFHKKKKAVKTDVAMAMKKKSSRKLPTVSMKGNKKMKRSKKGTVSMNGNKRMKGTVSMQGSKEMKAAKKNC